jgi:hypothetical protein
MPGPRRVEMLRCGRCGRPVSAAAVACRHCSADFDQVAPVPLLRRGIDARLSYLIIGALIGLVVIVVVIVAISRRGQAPSP